MYFKFVLIFAIVSVAICQPLEPKIFFGEAKPEEVASRALPKDWKTTDTGVARYLPIDDGRSNYGDLIHLQRQPNDVVLYSEVFHTNAYATEQQLQWKGFFPGYTITQIRVLNIGRQRIWCGSIGSGGSNGVANLELAANKAPRFLIDVYGHPA